MGIKFNNVCYSYDEPIISSKVALKDININLEEEKIHGIVGNSGSGKTTLACLINALIVPSSGSIEIDKYIIKKNVKMNNINEFRFNVGLVYQNPEDQFFESTVRKELEFGMIHFKYKLKYMNRRICEALTMVGLDESYLDLNPSKLSSSEKRKIAIASVLTFNPKILILDEPTIGLDNHSKKKLIMLIKKLKDRYHKTIIICTKDVNMLYPFVDNIVILNKGQVLVEGTKDEVYKHLSLLNTNHINVPEIVLFISKAINNKGVKLGRNTDVKDLIKDVYRNV
ncbi:MAG: ABC transporter ATP-binding protein [Bacilli bacterium]|nr:ABC transporter ATP-binding protein [Bacilli bacterium]